MFSKKWLFYRAAAKTRVKKAASLLEAGISPDLPFKNRNGRTALHLASSEGNVTQRRIMEGKKSNEAARFEMTKLLLEKGANVNARDDDGLTALHLASGDGCLRIARLLLEKGANANARDNEGNTALYYASSENLLEFYRPLP